MRGDLVEGTAGPRQPPGGEREPGYEAHLLPLAGLQDRLRGAIGEVVAILDRDDRHDVQRDLHLPHPHVRKADVPDLALVPQLRQEPDRVLEGYFGIGPVELVEVYALHLEPLQAALARLAQVLRAPVGDPPATGPRVAALGGDDQVIRVRVQRLGDQTLGDLGAVGIGGIDEVHAQLHRPPEHAVSLLGIPGLTPDARPGQSHGAETQTVHAQVAAQSERAGRRRVRSGISVGHASSFPGRSCAGGYPASPRPCLITAPSIRVAAPPLRRRGLSRAGAPYGCSRGPRDVRRARRYADPRTGPPGRRRPPGSPRWIPDCSAPRRPG